MLDDILVEARKLCEPDEEERKRVAKVAQEILQKASEVIAKRKIEGKAVIGGSYAKDTWLKGDCDIDLFLKFPTKIGQEEFKRLSMDMAEETLAGYPTLVRYSEHPYLEGFVNGIRVNVVPCFDVEPRRWISAADRSPYHTEYVKEHLKEELKADVRLLKKFLKVRNIYGAEVKTKGFSGYVCEVLILKYQSFINTLTAFSNFERGSIISLGEVPADVRLRFQNPIIILDPVDPERNLGAAVSEESLATLILSARSFLKKPRVEYFKIPDVNQETSHILKKILDNLILLKFKHKPRSPDIIWGQLHKTSEAIRKQLEIRGFEILKVSEASSEKDESAILLLTESTTLPNYVLKVGPEVYRKEDTARFIEKNLNRSTATWFTEDGRIVSLQERVQRDIVDVLSSILKNPKELGVSEGLREALKTSTTILTGKEALDAVENISWLRKEVHKFVSTDQLVFNSA
ncbi:MAG: CCA tRNA nucleotidyltransferase [Nitrososphaerales archaeon]